MTTTPLAIAWNWKDGATRREGAADKGKLSSHLHIQILGLRTYVSSIRRIVTGRYNERGGLPDQNGTSLEHQEEQIAAATNAPKVRKWSVKLGGKCTAKEMDATQKESSARLRLNRVNPSSLPLGRSHSQKKFFFSFYSVNRRNRRRKRRRPAASYKRSSDCRPRFTFVSRTLRPATCSVPPHSEWKRVELELERLSSSSSDTHNHRGKFSILWQIILIFKSNSIIIIHWSSDFVDNLITIQSNWKNYSLIFLFKSNSITILQLN